MVHSTRRNQMSIVRYPKGWVIIREFANTDYGETKVFEHLYNDGVWRNNPNQGGLINRNDATMLTAYFRTRAAARELRSRIRRNTDGS